jgi:signal transduction histidine kinase
LGDLEIDRYMQLAVFRTLQELMTNVVKHADATQAQAEISYHNNKIIILVSDNGSGIDPEKQSKDGIGLASIRSKADLLDGSVEIESLPGKGTSVKVILPYISN